METKIDVAIIEHKPNNRLPRYIGNGEYSHLMQVNPGKTICFWTLKLLACLHL